MGAKPDSSACRGCTVLGIRLLVCLLAIASLVLVLRSKQTVLSPLGLGYVQEEVKYSNTSALLYLGFSDIAVAVYCFVALVSSIPAALGRWQSGKAGRWAIFILDQVMAYVLLAAASAATEVAFLAENGMTKTSWAVLCDSYGHFCRSMKAAIALSFAAVCLLAVLSVVSARTLFGLYKRPLYAMKMRHGMLP